MALYEYKKPDIGLVQKLDAFIFRLAGESRWLA